MLNFDVNYIVKEEEGIVVCIISDCEENAMALVDKYTNIVACTEEFFINNEYKGVAKCDANDTFNVEYGKKLAYRKAYLKYITALEKKVKFIMNEYINYTTEMIEKFKQAVTKVDGKTEEALNLYHKILKEAE